MLQVNPKAVIDAAEASEVIDSEEAIGMVCEIAQKLYCYDLGDQREGGAQKAFALAETFVLATIEYALAVKKATDEE